MGSRPALDAGFLQRFAGVDGIALIVEAAKASAEELVTTSGIGDHEGLCRGQRLAGLAPGAFQKVHVDIIVRSDCTWMALCSTNPFKDGNGDQVIVRVMRLPVDPEKVEALKPLMTEGQRIAVVGGDLWIDFAGKPSQSKLLSALTTKRLGVGTMRNWNTVRGLTEMII